MQKPSQPRDAHTTHNRRPSDPTSPPSSKHSSPLTSPPLDPSKLNQQPAPLPMPASETASLVSSTTDGVSGDSAYLDKGGPVEPASHPTVAETGTLAKAGPGPVSGQLKRVEGGEKKDGKGIIKLGSFGGEGLTAKPPVGSFGSPKEGDGSEGSAIAD